MFCNDSSDILIIAASLLVLLTVAMGSFLLLCSLSLAYFMILIAAVCLYFGSSKYIVRSSK